MTPSLPGNAARKVKYMLNVPNFIQSTYSCSPSGIASFVHSFLKYNGGIALTGYDNFDKLVNDVYRSFNRLRNAYLYRYTRYSCYTSSANSSFADTSGNSYSKLLSYCAFYYCYVSSHAFYDYRDQALAFIKSRGISDRITWYIDKYEYEFFDIARTSICFIYHLPDMSICSYVRFGYDNVYVPGMSFVLLREEEGLS